MEKGRVYHLDIVKGLTMILVIWGHCGGEFEFPILFRWIYSFHVPIYFVISGYLNQKKAQECGIYKIHYNLLIPYMVFSSLYVALIALLKSLSNLSEMISYVFFDSLPRILLLDGLIATWYLSCLFLCEIIFSIELNAIRDYKKIAFLNAVICVISCYIPFGEDNWLAKTILRIFPALLCMTIGGLFFQYKHLMSKHVWFCCLIAQICLTIINGPTYMYHMTTGNYPILYGIQIISASITVLGISARFFNKNIKGISYLGKNTLIILGTHQSVIQIIYLILGHYDISLPNIASTSIFMSVIVICIEIPIIFIINKWFYWMLGKLKDTSTVSVKSPST